MARSTAVRWEDDPQLADYLAQQAEEAAYYAAQQERQLAEEAAGRGWDWEPQWGQQPCDEHCRARLRATSLGPLHDSINERATQ